MQNRPVCLALLLHAPPAPCCWGELEAWAGHDTSPASLPCATFQMSRVMIGLRRSQIDSSKRSGGPGMGEMLHENKQRTRPPLRLILGTPRLVNTADT